MAGSIWQRNIDVDKDGNATVTGNLTVEGTTTTIESTNTVIADKLIELGNGTSGTPSGDAGVIVERGSSTNAGLIWDESADEWVACTTSATGGSSGDLTLTDANLSCADLTASGDIILDDGGSLKEAGGTAAITFDGSGNVTKIGQDSMSSGDVLTWDGAKFVGEAPTTGDITGVTAGDGLSGGGNSGAVTLAVDLNELSAATVAVASDSIAIIDADDDGSKKESIADLVTAIAGTAASTGLSASSGVLSVSDLHPVGVNGAANQVLTDDGDGTVTSEAGLTFDSGLLTVSGNTDGAHTALVLKNEDDTADANGSVILRFDLEDTSGTAVDSGSIRVKKLNSFTSTGNTQDSKMDFYVSEDGTLTRQGAFVGSNEFRFGNRNSKLNVDASSGTNAAGKNLTVRGGAGTGSGAGGSIIFQTADGGGSGSNANSHVTALTIADDLSATFAGDLAVNGDTSTFASANSQDPLLIIKNTTNDQYGARLRFVKDKGAAGAANDECGVIEFLGDDANQDQVQFAKVAAIVKTHTDGQEGGELILEVATHDGESQPGLVLSDGDAEDEVDAVIGNGTSSVTTVSGDLNVSGGDIAYGNGQDATLTVDAVSGTNIAGKDLTIKAGVGTGTGDPGDIHFQVAVPGGSGSSAQSTVPTMSMSPEGVSTFWGGTAALGNDTGVGDIVTFGTEDSSDTLAAGRLMYLHTDGKWKYCDADAVATGGTQLLGIALGTAVSDGLLIRGFFKLNSYVEGTWNEGIPCYVSETTGEIDFTAPSASGDFVRVVGYGTDTSGVIYFNPSATNIVIA